MSKARWEHFPHQGDIGVRGIGASMEQAFEQAAVAMMAVVADISAISPDRAVEISCQAPDPELLLVEWLNAIVYEMATRNMLFGRFEVELGDEGLHGVAWGERVNREKHHPAVEIKGVTYTELYVGRGDGGQWVAQCVVDV